MKKILNQKDKIKNINMRKISKQEKNMKKNKYEENPEPKWEHEKNEYQKNSEPKKENRTMMHKMKRKCLNMVEEFCQQIRQGPYFIAQCVIVAFISAVSDF